MFSCLNTRLILLLNAGSLLMTKKIPMLIRTDYFLLFSHKTSWEHSEAIVTISLADYSTKQNPVYFFVSWIFSK